MEREVSTEESAYFSGSLQVKKKKKTSHDSNWLAWLTSIKAICSD